MLLLFFAAPARAGIEFMPETSRMFHDMNMRMLVNIESRIKEYREVKMSAVHKGATNALANLHEPQTIINSLLILDISNAASAFGRFVVNSTVGILGIIDMAGYMGIKRDRRDFGAVMGVWGMDTGATFSVPVLGPTNARDFSGVLVDIALDPISYFVLTYPVSVALYASEKSYAIYDNYDFFISTHLGAVDSFAAFQTMFAQNRNEEIRRIQLGLSGPSPRPSLNRRYDFDMEAFE